MLEALGLLPPPANPFRQFLLGSVARGAMIDAAAGPRRIRFRLFRGGQK